LPDDAEVHIGGFCAIESQLLENVIIRGRGQNSGFVQTRIFDQRLAFNNSNNLKVSDMAVLLSLTIDNKHPPTAS
jgi:hypothetical protein